MKIILIVWLILSLCTSRYISTSDINLSSLTSDLKVPAPYPRAMVREALGKSLIASLSNMADRFDESTSKTVTRHSIIGEDEEILILSYKIAKDFILHLNIIEFSDEQIQRYDLYLSSQRNGLVSFYLLSLHCNIFNLNNALF